MRVPLTIRDFLDRAELVYGDRVGVVDEPDQPAPSLGRAHLRARSRGAARAQAAGLDALGVGAGRAGRDRLARTRPGCSTAFFGVPRLRPGARADQLPARRRRGRATSSSTRGASVLLVDPELDERARRRRRAEHRFVLGAETDARAAAASTSSREPWDARRGRHRDDQLHAAARRRGPKGVQLTHRNLWLNAVDVRLAHAASTTATSTCTRCRCSTATAGACRTRSPAWAAATSCCARSTAPRSCAGSSEHGVTLLCGAPAVVAAVLDARRDVGRARSPAAAACASSSPARRRRRAPSSGSRPSSAGSSSRSTASPRPSPLLTINRAPRRVGRPRRRASGPSSLVARRRAGARRAAARSTTTARCSPGRNVVLDGLLGAARGDRRGASTDGWFHTGDGGSHRRRAATSRSPTARRT